MKAKPKPTYQPETPQHVLDIAVQRAMEAAKKEPHDIDREEWREQQNFKGDRRNYSRR